MLQKARRMAICMHWNSFKPRRPNVPQGFPLVTGWDPAPSQYLNRWADWIPASAGMTNFEVTHYARAGSAVARITSATPAAVSASPAIASQLSASPNKAKAISAVTAGVRKNRLATFDAAP